MKTRKIRRTLFIRAAEIIHSNDQRFCCCALDDARQEVGLSCENDGYNGPEEMYFHGWLKPANEEMGSPYYGGYFDRRNREARILGLLLCYELHKEGQKP